MIQMSSRTSEQIETWDLLKELGFQPDDGIYSDIHPGLRYDFGVLKLDASAGLNRWLRAVVMFGGVLKERRSITMIEGEMPLQVDSRELGIAWITYVLDQRAHHRRFEPPNAPAWLDEGRRYKYLLPWERETAEYEKRPRCAVPREWMRLALRTLREALAETQDDTRVVFAAAECGLIIRCGSKVIPIHGTAANWSDEVAVFARDLRSLPCRLMHETIGVSVWKGKLHIARRVWNLIPPEPKEEQS
jgi:hypothetical protein